MTGKVGMSVIEFTIMHDLKRELNAVGLYFVPEFFMFIFKFLTTTNTVQLSLLLLTDTDNVKQEYTYVFSLCCLLTCISN